MGAISSNGNESGRRYFQISRKGWHKDKANSEPRFFEYLKDGIPETDGLENREFETRNGNKERHYELFVALSGYIQSIWKEQKEIEGDVAEHLIVLLSDDDGAYQVDMGPIDGRYAQSLLNRFCSVDFDPDALLQIQPYAIDRDDKPGKQNIGTALKCGGNKIPARKADSAFNVPEPNTATIKGKTVWDFSPLTEFYWDWIGKNHAGLISGKNARQEAPEAPEAIAVPSAPAGGSNKKISVLNRLQERVMESDGDEALILNAVNGAWKWCQQNNVSLSEKEIQQIAGDSIILTADNTWESNQLPF